MLDKIMKLLSLDSLKGSRTKLTILLDVALYAITMLAPQYLSVDAWLKLQPILMGLGTFFGVEHFEKPAAPAPPTA